MLTQAWHSLKKMRIEARLTQRELSAHSGIAYGTLRRLESSGQGSLHDYLHLQTFLQTRLNQQIPPSKTASTAQRVRQSAADRTTSPDALSAVKPTWSTLSQTLGLSFAYDWSNPDMPQDILIAKVLEKARFLDVSKIFAYFGRQKVEQVAQAFDLNLNQGVLASLMPSIELGWQRSQIHHQSA